MKHGDFRVGLAFRCGGRDWRCTDVGGRVIVAICLEVEALVRIETGRGSTRTTAPAAMSENALDGPPYAVAEMVFDEYDIEGCELPSRGLA